MNVSKIPSWIVPITACIVIVIVYISTMYYERQSTKKAVQDSNQRYLMSEVTRVRKLNTTLLLSVPRTKAKSDSIRELMIYNQGWRDCLASLNDTLVRSMDNPQ